MLTPARATLTSLASKLIPKTPLSPLSFIRELHLSQQASITSPLSTTLLSSLSGAFSTLYSPKQSSKLLTTRYYATIPQQQQDTPSPASQQQQQQQPPTKPANAVFKVGAAIIPHPSKAYKGGEDAFLVSNDKCVLAVADGVGGWADEGVDPSLYSKGIMEGCKAFYEDKKTKNPAEIMYAGWKAASKIRGSSTCCVCVLDGYHLHYANLGDSGLLVIRGNGVLFRSKEQQHDFNFPYQLGTQSTDTPSAADCAMINVQDGDIVVVGTDGLFDNTYDGDIVAIITQNNNEPEQLATLIAQHASTKANRKHTRTPFGDNAYSHGYIHQGGKLDDITVVVGKVSIK